MPALTMTRSTFAQATAIQELETNLLGSLVLPGDEDYDSARAIQNAGIDRRPALVVRAGGVPDVIRTVKFARANGLPIAVRSGGHSFAGHSVADDAVVLDLSRMRNVSVDPERRLAWVQPGATSADLAERAQAHGLALSTGDVSSVGVGGLTLGGGIGWLVRKFGLTIDKLRSVDVVTAAGDLITASADENAELFWALRGGGGNFGVATGFEFQLEPVGNIYGGLLMLPATREVIRGWADYATNAPDELTTINAIMQAPPAPFVPAEKVGRLAFAMLVVYAGDPVEGEKALAPLRALAEPIADVIAPMPYPGIYEFTDEATGRAFATVRSMFTETLPDDLIDTLLEGGATLTSPMSMLQIRGLGGAMGRVPAGGSAFAHRDARFMTTIVAHWADAADGDVHTRWAEALWERINDHAQGVYVNFIQDETGRLAEAYPGATLDRLAAVKQQYDPTNLFRLNQNIAPRA